MRSELAGRADLVRALAAGGPELQGAVARLLGMEPTSPERAPPIAFPIDEPAHEVPAPVVSSPQPVTVEIPVPYWYARSFRVHERLAATSPRVAPDETASIPGPALASMAPAPLASGPSILTRLRRVSAFERMAGEVDIDRVVAQVSRGRLLENLPRRSRRSWGLSVHVIKDRHDRLMPYWKDQDDAAECLRRVYPCDGFQLGILDDGANEPRICWPRHQARFVLPDPGAVVLVLGDLGCLDRRGDRCREVWLALGRRYRENGNRTVALVPCDASAISGDLAGLWTVIPWEGALGATAAAPGAGEADRLADRILTLLSFALRLDPELIRAVRRLLVGGRSGAGIESLVWQSEALEHRHYRGATFRQEAARELRGRIDVESAETRRKIYELTEQVRQGTYQGVWHAERLALELEGRLVGLSEEGLKRAVNWFRRQKPLVEEKIPDQGRSGEQATWNRRVLARLPEEAYQGEAADSLHAIWSLVASVEQRPPDGLDPARLPPSRRPVRMVELRQLAASLVAGPVMKPDQILDTAPRGSLVGSIRARHAQIKVEPWAPIPAWVTDLGEDGFGHWRTFQVKGVSQRLRWIPPGAFPMGSPETEAGRYDDESPQHLVRITRGFWLFDSPCTQALWKAVMGKNPSQFRSPTRPVETVSWDDCQSFLERLNRLLDGASFSLPSEAQWEYACRAGTATSTYAGDMEILGDFNAPVLDPIAWYLGNCGVDFELKKGFDVSGFPGKQYESKTGGTHPVGGKAPNPWGLHDMLGNVWEWCRDGWDREFYRKSPGDDPVAPAGASARRVIRGGSWLADARYVRAASRDDYHPGTRDNALGFRCGEFQEPGPAVAGGGWSEVASASERRAEHRSDREPPSANRRPAWLGEGRNRLVVPGLTPIRVWSDVEELVIDVMTRPAWASAIGRDEFGLWAEFTIGETVRQRLRWISPGRFVMGSPREEAGRLDWEHLPRTVRIADGFWLFDTPCTQALWEAVMGDNPSRFRSPTRPVEQVSWEDCRGFVDKLNGLLAGLILSLPSEAQWEYACRAGTTTATYAGDLNILGQCNAPALDPIAWYSGNCGVDFDLDEGWDISGWPEKQYDLEKGGTHPVGRKAPNGWGLYDMLGNVFEWCEDKWEADSDAPGESAGAPAHRVIRGGSWYDVARVVRAAYRVDCLPGLRSINLGFRCGEFRSGEVERGASRPERVRSTAQDAST
jgi:formylglycine-generating enzyme required for sulfatase activity